MKAWYEEVAEGETIICLGDITVDGEALPHHQELWRKAPGTKWLVLGNHDVDPVNRIRPFEIDSTAFAVDLVRNRRLKDPTIPTLGILADLEGARKLAGEQPFSFESWAVSRLPGFAPNTQQRGDGRIDGRATLAVAPDDVDSRLALAQVKGGRFNVSYLRDFRYVMEREAAAVGCFITLDPAPAKHRGDAKNAGRVHVAGQPYDRLQLWSMAEYFDQRLPRLPVLTDPYTGRPLNQSELF